MPQRGGARGLCHVKVFVPFVPFVCFVSFVFPVVAGCGAPPARAEQARVAQTRWHALGSWSGRGSRQTESFDVVSGALRLTWETRATGAAGEGHFRVWLYSAISGRPLQQFVDSSGAASGTAHAADEPRTSYLVIEAEQLDWTITLEEASQVR